jgi:hypothetical protein
MLGWMTSIGARDEVVRKIVDLDENRSKLANKMQNARDFAKAHSFEVEFKSRVDHLRRLAKDPQRRAETIEHLMEG